MKHSILLTLILVCQVSFAQTKLNFERIPSMPNEAYAFASSASNQDIFALTGGDDFQRYTSKLQIYDTRVNFWVDIPLKELPITNYSSAVYMEDYHGLLTLGGTQPYGSNVALVEDIRMIDLEDYSITKLGKLPFPARNMGLAKKGNTIYFFGGSTQATPIFTCSNKFFSYDLDLGHLEMLPDMPVAMETDGAIVDGNLYVFGGYDRVSLSKVFKYNLSKKEWTELNPLPKPLSSYEVAQYGKYIILVGDFNNTNQLILYDTENERPEYYKMNFEARHLGASVSGDDLYVYGGVNQSPHYYIRQEAYKLNLKQFIASREQ